MRADQQLDRAWSRFGVRMRVEKLFQFDRAFGQRLGQCQLDFFDLVEFFLCDLAAVFLFDWSFVFAAAAGGFCVSVSRSRFSVG